MKTLIALHPPILVGAASLALSVFYVIFLLGAIVMMFDIAARYKEYKFMCALTDDVKRQSMLRYMKTSWCTRTVAKAAYPPAKQLYYSLGYRWYHILPDKFFKRITTGKFWLSLLGFTKVV